MKVYYAEKHDSEIIMETKKFFFSTDELAEKFINEMNMSGDPDCKPWCGQAVHVTDNDSAMREIIKGTRM